MTIYLVTRGEYSDYGIVAAFSSKAKAEKYMQDDGSSYKEYNEVEEYRVDEEVGAKNLSIWRVAINLSNGDIPDKPHCFPRYAVPFRGRSDVHANGEYGWAESTVSAEHCLKVAAECRQKWLRQ